MKLLTVYVQEAAGVVRAENGEFISSKILQLNALLTLALASTFDFPIPVYLIGMYHIALVWARKGQGLVS